MLENFKTLLLSPSLWINLAWFSTFLIFPIYIFFRQTLNLMVGLIISLVFIIIFSHLYPVNLLNIFLCFELSLLVNLWLIGFINLSPKKSPKHTSLPPSSPSLIKHYFTQLRQEMLQHRLQQPYYQKIYQENLLLAEQVSFAHWIENSTYLEQVYEAINDHQRNFLTLDYEYPSIILLKRQKVWGVVYKGKLLKPIDWKIRQNNLIKPWSRK